MTDNLNNNVTPIEDFDWETYAEGGEGYNKEEKEKLIESYTNTLSKISDKEVVTGVVTSMDKREVIINIGYKSEGVVPMSEFRYNPDLKVGDEVEVYIESQEDKRGQLVLSHKKARASRSWERVNEAFRNNEVIKGYIKCRTKGGMIVDVFGIEAFLPGSQIDVNPIHDYDMFVDKTMEFKVVKINPEFKNVVVSHKILIEEELEQQKKKIIASLEKGQVLEGTVKNITSYGAFIDLGGVDGLIHITDLSWERVQHPEEVVKLNDKINVVILDFDEEKKRIALGLKQLTPHPWDALDPNLKVGDIVKGKVVVITDYGAFVEIAPGVEGLVHVSEMSWTQRLHTAHDFLNVGDEIEAVILSLDREDRKMSLGMRQLKPDPWETIEERYPIGSTHTATVRNFTNFGAFVEIEEGVEGLVHISDLSWTKKIKHPSEITEIGAPLEVQVLEIDKENRRLSLGHKQLKENPWDVFETIFTEGSVHEGTVAELTDKGAIIALPYGVEAFASSKHLVKEDGSQAQPDEKLEFKIIEFNKDAKRIVVSHTRVSEDEQTEKTDSSKRKPRRSSKKGDSETASSPMIEKTTFGDIEELVALKEKLENQKAATKKGAKKKAKAKEEKAEETIAVEDEKAEKEVSEVEVKDNEKEVKQTETETEVEAKTEAGETETTTEVKEKSDTETTDVESNSEKEKAEKEVKEKSDADTTDVEGGAEEVKEEAKKEAKETKAEISVETKEDAPVKKEEKEAPKEKGEAEAEETTKQEEKKDAPKEEK